VTIVMAGLVVAMAVFETLSSGAPVGPYAGVVGVMLAIGIPCLLWSRAKSREAGGVG